MPMRSQAQRAYLHIHHPKIATRWEKHTPDDVKLPKHVKEMFGESLDDVPETENNDELPDPIESGDEFRKVAPTWAIEMDEPFKVDTIEGETDGKEGDYLCKGPGGDMWVVDGDVFLSTYRPAADNEIEPSDAEYNILGDEPKMTEVFRASPPPGSQPIRPSDWAATGQAGQNARNALDGLKKAGQNTQAYKTPDGKFVTYPSTSTPGSTGPMNIDMTKGGVLTPMTGSSTMTPQPAGASNNPMKGSY